jgi:hypothetical protein
LLVERPLEDGDVIAGYEDKLPALLARIVEKIQFGGFAREVVEIQPRVFPVSHGISTAMSMTKKGETKRNLH